MPTRLALVGSVLVGGLLVLAVLVARDLRRAGELVEWRGRLL